MNVSTLAKEAEEAANKYKGILAPDVLRAIKLGHVAQWLYMQDDDIPDHVKIMRANGAILRIYENETL
jgi:hypothetical protein